MMSIFFLPIVFVHVESAFYFLNIVIHINIQEFTTTQVLTMQFCKGFKVMMFNTVNQLYSLSVILDLNYSLFR